MNLRRIDATTLGISMDETTSAGHLDQLLGLFGQAPRAEALAAVAAQSNVIPEGLRRTSPYLTHPVFNSYHTEHEMLRYLRALEAKDLAVPLDDPWAAAP